MIVLAGAHLVLADRIVIGSLLIESDRIVGIEVRPNVNPERATVIDVSGRYLIPGFVDVHLHGVEGHDTLDGAQAVAQIAARLPRYGVTAFSPTSVACTPDLLRGMLEGVRSARAEGALGSARVLPAHLESNFINPDYRGAQPASCLRLPFEGPREGAFNADDILGVIDSFRPDVATITLAPELPRGLELVTRFVTDGYRVSLGHSAATFEEASEAIRIGARGATHLFNRMPPLAHRSPGLAGAVLAHEELTAELICDGYHVHPAMCRTAIAAKSVTGIMAITDATAGAGLAVGSSSRLGSQSIRVTAQAAVLPDGTLAGSTLTMDRAFRTIVSEFGFGLVEAVTLCSTTPAREMGLTGLGVLRAGQIADLVVLDRELHVERTFIGGREAYQRTQRSGRVE